MTSAAVDGSRCSHGAGDLDAGRLLRAAVALVERALTSPGPEDAAPAGAPPLDREKLRCEAAMLLRAAAPLADGDPALAAALDQLAAALATPDPQDLAVRLCLNPGVALDLALVELHLRSLGLGDPRLEPLLDDLLGTDRLHGPERPANRVLEQVWLRSLWSGDVDDVALDRALSASALASELDHLSGTTDDAYAFTHALLYATDHGRRPVALPRPIEAVEADADALLAVALDAGNHDVTAEVLWTWPVLRLPWSPLAARARALLAEVSETWGFLPGPGFDAAVHDRLAPELRDAYVLRTSYHTTLVHGLLQAATLTQPAPAPPPPADPPTGAADALTAQLPPGSRSTAWWRRYAALPPAERDALAPALVTMALRRAFAATDLVAVQQTLGLAAEHRLPETPATRQARVLLRRAVRCAGLRR